MPYWQRQRVLSDNLAKYRDLYPHDGIEIVIVDDGSPEPPVIDGPFPWPVTVERLADKDHALNPCTAFNTGVARARGDYIVLTNPEVRHREPILGEMRTRARDIGRHAYVAAACWSGEHNWWFCHSRLMPHHAKVGRAPSPPGSGLHFCAMLHRSLYEKAGGFDEDYRDGQGYEDNDFLWRLARAEAEFAIFDDLVTDHLPCPRSKWPAGGAARNRTIFERKWHERADAR
jgi:GT2 family glycosyltransferase